MLHSHVSTVAHNGQKKPLTLRRPLMFVGHCRWGMREDELNPTHLTFNAPAEVFSVIDY